MTTLEELKKRAKAPDPAFSSINPVQSSNLQSIPGVTPPTLMPQPAPAGSQLVNPNLPQKSAVSQQPLELNRINKFFLPQGEVSQAEFNQFKAESKILAEGGRRVVSQQERASIESGIAQQGQGSISQPSQFTPTPEQVDAGQRAFATEIVGAASVFIGAEALGAKILGSKIAARKLEHTILGGAIASVPVLSERKKVSEANNNFANSKGIISELITHVQNGQMSLEQALILINAEMANVNSSEKSLKVLTSDSLIAFASGGSNGLADIESFRRDYQNIILPALIQSATQQAAAKQQRTTSFG